MPEQIPFSTDSFADNPEPRCPSLLLLDVSGSMEGDRIRELNNGIQSYSLELAQDEVASKRVEVAIVTFGGTVTHAADWCTADNFAPPTLAAAGNTPMGQAISEGLSLIKRRKQTYRDNGILYYRPWVFLLTDGDPTDSWDHAVSEISEGETKREFSFYAVGVQGARKETLKRLNPKREPLMLDGMRFKDLFLWLSRSQATISRSQQGEQVSLANPCGPNGWAVADW